MTYQANQSEEAQALLPRIDAAIKRIVNGQGCMRIPADLEDPDLVLADCKKLLKALAAPPPQAKAEPAPDIVPTGWLRWQDDEWTYEHNTVYQVKGAPKNTVVRIALYATPVAKAEPAGVSDEWIVSAWEKSEGYRPGQIAQRHAIFFARAILSAAPSTGVREDADGVMASDEGQP